MVRRKGEGFFVFYRAQKMIAGILNSKLVKHYFDLNCPFVSELVFSELQLRLFLLETALNVLVKEQTSCN